MRRASELWELMRMVLSVMLSMVRSFIGGTLAFEGFIWKLSGSFEICEYTVSNVLRSIVGN